MKAFKYIIYLVVSHKTYIKVLFELMCRVGNSLVCSTVALLTCFGSGHSGGWLVAQPCGGWINSSTSNNNNNRLA